MKRTLALLASSAVLAAPLVAATLPPASADPPPMCTAIADGDWTDPAIWGGACIDSYPSSSASATISGHHVTLMPTGGGVAAFSASTINVTDGGTLTIGVDEYGALRETELTAYAVNLTNGGGLRGAGTVNAPVSNPSGFVEPLRGDEEPLKITGSYTQNGGRLKIPVSTWENHTLLVAGTATLGGTLELAFDPEFEPASDISYPFLTGHNGSQVTGNFATVTRTGGNQYAGSGMVANGPTSCTADCTFRRLSFPNAPHSVEPMVSKPVITGNPWPGQTLRCSYTQQGYPGSYTFINWFRDGTHFVIDANKHEVEYTDVPTYTVQSSDIGHTIACKVEGGTWISMGGGSTTPVTIVPPPSATTLPPSATPKPTPTIVKVAPKISITVPQILVTAAEQGLFCVRCYGTGTSKVQTLGPKVVPFAAQSLIATPGQPQTVKPKLTLAARKAIAKSRKKVFKLSVPVTFVPADGGALVTKNVTITIRKKRTR